MKKLTVILLALIILIVVSVQVNAGVVDTDYCPEGYKANFEGQNKCLPASGSRFCSAYTNSDKYTIYGLTREIRCNDTNFKDFSGKRYDTCTDLDNDLRSGIATSYVVNDSPIGSEFVKCEEIDNQTFLLVSNDAATEDSRQRYDAQLLLDTGNIIGYCPVHAAVYLDRSSCATSGGSFVYGSDENLCVLSTNSSQFIAADTDRDLYTTVEEARAAGLIGRFSGGVCDDEDPNTTPRPTAPIVPTQPGGGTLPPFDPYEACNDLNSTEEAACRRCIDRGEDSSGDDKHYIYTAIGCVDASRDGVVIRFFQIALGLMSGLGVYRVMKAALLLQQDSPTAKEEAQEEITSAIWAVIFLVGIFIILNYIGVSILNILPSVNPFSG